MWARDGGEVGGGGGALRPSFFFDSYGEVSSRDTAGMQPRCSRGRASCSAPSRAT